MIAACIKCAPMESCGALAWWVLYISDQNILPAASLPIPPAAIPSPPPPRVIVLPFKSSPPTCCKRRHITSLSPWRAGIAYWPLHSSLPVMKALAPPPSLLRLSNESSSNFPFLMKAQRRGGDERAYRLPALHQTERATESKDPYYNVANWLEQSFVWESFLHTGGRHAPAPHNMPRGIKQ